MWDPWRRLITTSEQHYHWRTAPHNHKEEAKIISSPRLVATNPGRKFAKTQKSSISDSKEEPHKH